MLKAHEPILADDPDSLLQYERGIFEVVSPRSERVRVVCPPLHLVAPARGADCCRTTGRQWWRIEKISDA